MYIVLTEQEYDALKKPSSHEELVALMTILAAIRGLNHKTQLPAYDDLAHRLEMNLVDGKVWETITEFNKILSL